MLSTHNNSVASSVSSSKRIESTDFSSSLEKESHDEKVCFGRCKAIVRRIVAQVRAETDQWSQMQEMLGQVRVEMEELQTSRHFWEVRALDSDDRIRSLNSSVQEWRQKAVSSEIKARGLQEQVSSLNVELNSSRKGEKTKVKKANHSPNPRDLQNEMEKRVLICHMKENNYSKEYNGKLESRRNPNSCTNRTPPHTPQYSEKITIFSGDREFFIPNKATQKSSLPFSLSSTFQDVNADIQLPEFCCGSFIVIP